MKPIEMLFVPLGRALRGRRSDEAASLTRSPHLATPNSFALTSPAYSEGGEIPARHCGLFIGPNISPALQWGPLPPATAALLLLFEDIDVPLARPQVHNASYLDPPPDSASLAEGALNGTGPGIQHVRGRLGHTGYTGPRPLPGHGTHRYRFHLYALDARPAVDPAAPLPAHLPALAGHVLAKGRLEGYRTP